MKVNCMLRHSLQIMVVFMLSNNQAIAEQGTVLNFPSRSVGKLDIFQLSGNPPVPKVISRLQAQGRVVIPAACSITFTFNYNGSQDASFILGLPPDIIGGVSCNEMEFSDKEIAKVAHLKKLVSLEAEGTDMTDSGAQQLSGLTELRKLNIGNTLITPAGLSFICGMKKLVSLTLSRNIKIGNQLNPCLSKLTELQRVDLCGTNLSDNAVTLLIPLTKLEDLTLKRNNVTDKCISPVLKLKGLKRLDLSDTRVTLKGLKQLSALPNLKMLIIRERSFTPEELIALRKSLPGVTLQNDVREQDMDKSLFAPLK